MKRWRVKSRAWILAERLFWCVTAFAIVNWTLNVCQYHWTAVLGRLRISTWVGCLELRWQFASPGDVLPELRAYFASGGVVGRDGLSTVLGHVRWLPSLEMVRVGSRVLSGTLDRPHATLLLPMWGLGIGSAVPLTIVARRNRRRRRERLCERCEYPLDAIPRPAEGCVVCPECGF